jgi:hypothetical protein
LHLPTARKPKQQPTRRFSTGSRAASGLKQTHHYGRSQSAPTVAHPPPHSNVEEALTEFFLNLPGARFLEQRHDIVNLERLLQRAEDERAVLFSGFGLH